MLLTLYDQYGSVKATLSPNDTSTQDKEIQGDNVLSLSFTLYEYVGIDVNDYVDFQFIRIIQLLGCFSLLLCIISLSLHRIRAEQMMTLF